MAKSRRDKCFAAAEKMAALNPNQRLIAWQILTCQIAELGDHDMPKFRDLYAALRLAAAIALRTPKTTPFPPATGRSLPSKLRKPL